MTHLLNFLPNVTFSVNPIWQYGGLIIESQRPRLLVINLNKCRLSLVWRVAFVCRFIKKKEIATLQYHRNRMVAAYSFCSTFSFVTSLASISSSTTSPGAGTSAFLPTVVVAFLRSE
ncbi:hypothetical protein BC936DRAFT_147547 [Jimgerdemannia flammicorona]|uniref:Uncharacterized protein n=1 Tax=Jimgerdemannia flammicorona TaxID=994334 RepID=A0A433D527_9FUNG|nr:hypothetical protein BC936DRAFT_147547 [Jimgerdemannia flammicorona]